MHVFYAHGGGLGHLTRISKLIDCLNLPVKDVIIITPSAFTKYFNYRFVNIAWNDSVLNWTKTIKKTIETCNLTTFYIDTFPLGLKGELVDVYNAFPELKYAYIARLLKWDNYLNTVPFSLPIKLHKTFLLELLYPEHEKWIENHSETTLKINFSTKEVLPVKYMDAPYVLVVHSGGKDDVLKICNKAIHDYQHRPDVTLVVFTQVDITFDSARVKVHDNIFPVNQFFHDAEKIYTGAGFNSMQELIPYKNKHISIPFKKIYDDQFFRYTKGV